MLRRTLRKHNVWGDDGAVECISYSILADVSLGKKPKCLFCLVKTNFYRLCKVVCGYRALERDWSGKWWAVLCSSTKIIPEYRKIRNLFPGQLFRILGEELSLYNTLVNFIGHLNKDYNVVSAHFWIAKQNKSKFTKKTKTAHY